MTHYEEWKLRQEMLEAGRMVYEKGNLVSKDGNLSVRLPDGNILITCTGCCKGRMGIGQISKMAPDGTLLSGEPTARDYRMHVAVYRERPDAMAIIHTHPPVTTGFAVSTYDVESVMIPEIKVFIGEIAFARYATPATADVGESLLEAMRRKPDANAIIMAFHGALVFDRNIMEAAYKILSVDMALQATMVAKLMGGLGEIPPEKLAELE